MQFLRRISRSRSNSRANSQSYTDDYPPHDNKAVSNYDDPRAPQYRSDDPSHDHHQQQQQHSRGLSSRHGGSAPQLADKDLSAAPPAMYRGNLGHGNGAYGSPPMSAGGVPRGTVDGMSNGYGSLDKASGGGGGGVMASVKESAAPELLMQAFNQALRPYHDKVETLEAEIADLRAYIDQLELQRSDVHAWIDKRGLRPDVPVSIARQMDMASHETSPTHAAATLNAQLDRKITIVNFDLHRLQDDLNDSLPTPSFSACMLKFLPDIARLAALPSGPRHAFDLLLKLGGNLNSHGGLESGDDDDLAERRRFYARLDDSMVDVVRARFRDEGDAWGVTREIKRIEKTGAYLRTWGVEPYFPHTLDVMRSGDDGAHAQPQAQPGAGDAASPTTPGGYA